MMLDAFAVFLLVGGTVFFTAGTIGLIRFPGVRGQLHALTKADNLGLGLTLSGVGLLSGSFAAFITLLLVWLLAVGSASVSAQALAGMDAGRNGGGRLR